MADGATQGPASQAVADSRRLAQTLQRKRASEREPRSTAAAGIDGVHKRRVAAGGGHGGVCGHASDDVGGSSRVESQINLLSASLSSSWATSTAARPRSPVRRKRRMQPSQPRPRCTAPQQTERGRERVPVLLLLSLPGPPGARPSQGTHPPTARGRPGGRRPGQRVRSLTYISTLEYRRPSKIGPCDDDDDDDDSDDGDTAKAAAGR